MCSLYQKNWTSEPFSKLKGFGLSWNRIWKPVGSHLFLSQTKNYCRFLVSHFLCVPSQSYKKFWGYYVIWLCFSTKLARLCQSYAYVLCECVPSCFPRCKSVSQELTETKTSWNHYSTCTLVLKVNNEKLKWLKWL